MLMIRPTGCIEHSVLIEAHIGCMFAIRMEKAG